VSLDFFLCPVEVEEEENEWTSIVFQAVPSSCTVETCRICLVYIPRCEHGRRMQLQKDAVDLMQNRSTCARTRPKAYCKYLWRSPPQSHSASGFMA
jgi:hypothetical protein